MEGVEVGTAFQSGRRSSLDHFGGEVGNHSGAKLYFQLLGNRKGQ